MRELYPPCEPWSVEHLDVGQGHQLYIEQCGHRGGIPAVFLHGGPGSGCKADHRQFFNPARYHIVLLDQRGSGRSTPLGSVTDNTTSHLVEDLERIRAHCGIDAWVLFGGSWGSALAIAYAQAHPERVLGMVLRGSFLARQGDVDWFFRDGARRFLPAQWQTFTERVAAPDNGELIEHLHSGIFGANEAVANQFAQAWDAWSTAVVMFSFDQAPSDGASEAGRALVKARIELHYARHRYFLRENQLLAEAERLPRVPTTLVHGARDLTCTADAAWALHQAIPNSRLEILRSAGHLSSERPMVDALIRASDEMADALAGS